MTSPAPHAGLAVVAALNILEGFNVTSQMLRNSTYHRTAEVVSLTQYRKRFFIVFLEFKCLNSCPRL